MRSVAGALLFVGLLLDLYSLVVRVRRSQGKTRDSGIPLVALLLYYINAEWLNQLFVMSTPGREMVLWTGVHVLCQYVLPLLHRWLFGKHPDVSLPPRE